MMTLCLLPNIRGFNRLGEPKAGFEYESDDLLHLIDEAAAFLADPEHGICLIELCKALLLHADQYALEILGSSDDVKLRLCVFHRARTTASSTTTHIVAQLCDACTRD